MREQTARVEPAAIIIERQSSSPTANIHSTKLRLSNNHDHNNNLQDDNIDVHIIGQATATATTPSSTIHIESSGVSFVIVIIIGESVEETERLRELRSRGLALERRDRRRGGAEQADTVVGPGAKLAEASLCPESQLDQLHQDVPCHFAR